jgi:DNA replication protein DnaC
VVIDCACGGTGWIRVVQGERTGVVQCACLKRRIQAKQLEQLGERFRHASFDLFIPTDDLQAGALGIVTHNPAQSYFLWGSYGRGKTHLASAQYRALTESGQSCAWRSMSELLNELRRAEVHDETSTILQRARHADFFHLFLDDLDKFKPTEFKGEALFDLFDTIYRRRLGITITSNYALGVLGETDKLHPAIIRRIDDMCLAVQV